MNEQQQHDVLPMWIVYDHPSDRPNEFVARRWEIADGVAKPTSTVRSSVSLATLRRTFIAEGFTRLERSAKDEAQIVETWL